MVGRAFQLKRLMLEKATRKYKCDDSHLCCVLSPWKDLGTRHSMSCLS